MGPATTPPSWAGRWSACLRKLRARARAAAQRGRLVPQEHCMRSTTPHTLPCRRDGCNGTRDHCGRRDAENMAEPKPRRCSCDERSERQAMNVHCGLRPPGGGLITHNRIASKTQGRRSARWRYFRAIAGKAEHTRKDTRQIVATVHSKRKQPRVLMPFGEQPSRCKICVSYMNISPVSSTQRVTSLVRHIAARAMRAQPTCDDHMKGKQPGLP